MADNELLIKINADAKNAEKAFDDVKAKSADLEGQLADVAKISAVAFAALTAVIGSSIAAYSEAKQASDELNLSLQNQGIYSKDLVARYDALATSLQNSTGIDGDKVKSVLALTQAQIGQLEITPELTKATADFAAAQKIDLASAFEIVSKGINGNVIGFKKLGIEIDANASQSDRLSQITQELNQRYQGQAAAVEQAKGGVNILKQSFSDVVESIGKQFFPVFQALTAKLTTFFNFINDNPALVDLTVAVLAAGAAVAGIALAIAVAVPAFTALTAAMAAFGVVSNVALAGIPLLIGAIVAGAVLIAQNFDTIKRIAFSLADGLKAFFQELGNGLATIIDGIKNLDITTIKKGIDEVTGAAAAGNAARLKSNEEFLAEKAKQDAEAEVKQTEAGIANGKERNDKQRQIEAENLAIKRGQQEVLRLQNQDASADLIKLKQDEVATLQAIQKEDDNVTKNLLRQKLTDIRALQDEFRAAEVERNAALREEDLALLQEIQQADLANLTSVNEAKRLELEKSILTEKDAEKKALEDQLKARIENRNLELQDRVKYGKAVATIQAALRSEEVQGAKTAGGELVALQQSTNSTLKGIGKAAALSQIAIATSESAMNIYRGFSTIPIVGPALGVAGAAAAVAFGAERAGSVISAFDGGLITGGVKGVDSVPALLAPGELVVPERNFEQVVGAVRGGGQDNSQITSLLESIDSKLSQPSQTIINGDISSDQNYIDALVKQISDALEFRNARLFGVTT